MSVALRSMLSTGLVAGWALLWTIHGASAAEIRLRAESSPAGTIVRLADVADVLAASADEADRLGSLELFAAPAAGGARFVEAREILDVLLMRGINPAEHRLTGASRVRLGATQVETVPAEPRLPNSGERLARQRAAQAVVAHLQNVAGAEPWEVELQLHAEPMRLLADPAARVQADGGASPWIGAQQFVLTVECAGQSQQFHVAAQVTLPAAVVVAVRSLARGTIIQAHDVTLQRGVLSRTSGEPLERLEDAIGCAAARAVAAGQPLDRESVQLPLLVRRGDAVTIYARAPGMRVRTTVRAREDGALGDLIPVESLETRERFYARVCGVQEVEVFAQPVASVSGGSAALPGGAR